MAISRVSMQYVQTRQGPTSSSYIIIVDGSTAREQKAKCKLSVSANELQNEAGIKQAQTRYTTLLSWTGLPDKRKK